MDDEFELPATKRIRRLDLRSSSSPPPLPHTNYPSHTPVFDFEIIDAPSPVQSNTLPEDAHGFEFRLFRSPPKDARTAAENDVPVPAVQRIYVSSPTPTNELGDGAILGPGRALGYYLTAYEDASVSREKKMKFAAVAVDGKDVRQKGLGSCEWAGCHLPWRIVRTIVRPEIPSVGLQQNVEDSRSIEGQRRSNGDMHVRKKRRAGKKRRMAIRKRLTSESEKFEAQRVKKARKNSRRKARRRELAKEKKRDVDAKEISDNMRTGNDS